MVTYPTRCVIIDVDAGDYRIGNLLAKTPDASKPHVGKRGLAELTEEGCVRITLDDGLVVYGYECWWEPVVDEKVGDV